MGISQVKLLKLEREKTDLLEAFAQVRGKILGTSRQIAPQDIEIPFVGFWNILDLLAHLRGWDDTNLQAAQDVLKGKLPDFYNHYDKDWASYNAALVARHRKAGIEHMQQAVEESHAALVAYLRGLSAQQLLTDQGVRHGNNKVIISRLIRAETKDEARHLSQIEGFIRSRAGEQDEM